MPSFPLLRIIAHVLCLLPLPAFACSGSLHIELTNAGVYALSFAEVTSKQPGLAGCAIEQLNLESQGKPVPLRVVDNGNGRFDEGDRIEWIGERLHGPTSWFDSFSINNAYLLSASAGTHARLTDRASSGTRAASLQRTLHFEQENLMIRLDQNQQKPGEEPDVWHWAKLTHADPQPFTTEFDLADLAARGADASLRINVRGISTIYVMVQDKSAKPRDHSLEVRVNGRLLKQLTWDGRDELTETLVVPIADLNAKGNRLTLSVPKRALPWNKDETAVDVVMFNWAEWRYPLAGTLDAGSAPLQTVRSDTAPVEINWTDAQSPVLYGDDGLRRPGEALGNGRYRFAAAAGGTTLYPVSGSAFAAPTLLRAMTAVDWRSPASGYDYLIVSHASLIDAVRPLAAYHESRGLKVAVIDVADVYDVFNHGITHPQAVRNLVDQAWHNWPQPRPRFLLLVGDASFDIRSETYNDLAYAKFANNPQELQPGHFSGIPATAYENASKQLGGRNLIPTWQYPSPEGQSASDNWFGAVDGDDYHPVVAVGRFPVVEPAEVTAIVDKTIKYMSQPQAGTWRRDVMFITDESEYFRKASDSIATSIGEQGFLADKIYASPDEADNVAHQSAIKDGLNAGQLLVHFIGHGGRFIWRTGPPDLRKNHDLFTLDDVSQLSNGNRLPMVLSMTCYSAPFDNPTEDSIGERFLREADKGAIAVFAASWRNAPSTAFSTALVKELLNPGATIGEGIVRAKKQIDDRVLVEMYNLLGDPAVVLERPRADARLMLSADAWNPGVLVALPGLRFSGQVALDWLDESRQLIATSTYRAEQSTFRVPIPRLGPGKVAHFVRVYASDEAGVADASGVLSLQPVRPVKARSSWFGWLGGANEKPHATDTVKRGGFDGDEVADTTGNP